VKLRSRATVTKARRLSNCPRCIDAFRSQRHADCTG
jgi:hypothetical protein